MKKGFTLVELLVLVAIIAILGCILSFYNPSYFEHMSDGTGFTRVQLDGHDYIKIPAQRQGVPDQISHHPDCKKCKNVPGEKP